MIFDIISHHCLLLLTTGTNSLYLQTDSRFSRQKFVSVYLTVADPGGRAF